MWSLLITVFFSIFFASYRAGQTMMTSSHQYRQLYKLYFHTSAYHDIAFGTANTMLDHRLYSELAKNTLNVNSELAKDALNVKSEIAKDILNVNSEITKDTLNVYFMGKLCTRSIASIFHKIDVVTSISKILPRWGRTSGSNIQWNSSWVGVKFLLLPLGHCLQNSNH